MPHHDTLEDRMMRQEELSIKLDNDFEALKMLLEKNNTSLEEFVDLAKAFKFGLKLLGMVERVSVFIAKVTIAGGALWAGWKFLIKEAIAHGIRHIK